MNVLDTGIVHPSIVTCLRIECTLKQCTKNGWRNTSPIQFITCLTYQKFLYFWCNGWDIECRIIEQASVYIFELFSFRVNEHAIAIACTQSDEKIF